MRDCSSGREAGEQRQDFGLCATTAEGVLSQCLGRFADFAFAGQEDEDVAGTDTVEFIASIDDRIVQVALVVFLGLLRLHRAVADIDRIQASRHLDHRRLVEMLGKALGVDRRRGDEQFEVGPLGQQLLKVAEQEIDVQAALVRLVDDQSVVLAEPRIALRLGKQDAVGHQLDVGLRRRPVGEADLVADVAAEFAFQFLRDARSRRARGDAARLRVADQASRPAPQFEADLRQLRRLARAGFAADDHHLVLPNQFGGFRRAAR